MGGGCLTFFVKITDSIEAADLEFHSCFFEEWSLSMTQMFNCFFPTRPLGEMIQFDLQSLFHGGTAITLLSFI